MCVYVGEAGKGGRHGWFGKSDSIELRKAKLILCHTSTTLEASRVSSGEKRENMEELKGSPSSLAFRELSIHQEQWHCLGAC